MMFNKNLKNVLLVIFATFILSACSTAKKSGDIDGDVIERRRLGISGMSSRATAAAAFPASAADYEDEAADVKAALRVAYDAMRSASTPMPQ